MQTRITLTSFLFLFSYSILFSQDFTLGVENGINYSNLRGDIFNNNWQANPGPVNGIFAKYSLGKWFTLQSGTNFVSFTYRNRDGNDYYYYTDEFHTTYSSSSYWNPSSIAPTGGYYYYPEETSLNFIRLPLQLKFKTQGKLHFEMGGGAYYAFLVNDEYRGKDKDLFINKYGKESLPSMTDWGWILSAGLNYSVSNRLELNLNAQTTYGQKVYLDENEGKNGATEITFGVGYKLFTGTKNQKHEKNDSTRSNISLLPHSGILLSTTANPKYRDQYSSSLGFSSGVSVRFTLDQNVSIISGAWYERKGYELDYVGDNIFLYMEPKEGDSYVPISTKVNLDYVTIPFLFEFDLGGTFSKKINFGLYYSFMQNAMVKGEITETYSSTTQYSIQKRYINHNIDGRFRQSDFGFAGGVRFEYPVWQNTELFFGANCAFGFEDILDKEYARELNAGQNQKILTSSYSFVLGFAFQTPQN
ncbi:porin family protein [Maribellus maritimus]|uniref:porin family protein n=1 Tax=Maribellus maritimus TaxID=2870838 RepID=UPI001EEAFF8D|nr:porin family protein [Maribellus maritimus]MCG6188647.1 PorT family protein [Maribellus maritimus]